MPRKKKDPITFVEAMRRLHEAGMDRSATPNRALAADMETFPTLDDRLKAIFNLIDNNKRQATQMLFFVMYDIESNKVRQQVVKYLLRQGCNRVQKSIFLADLPIEKYEKIKADLTAVQECYDNEDSILVVPISTDYLKAMKVIGQNINLDVIMRTKNTLFF